MVRLFNIGSSWILERFFPRLMEEALLRKERREDTVLNHLGASSRRGLWRSVHHHARRGHAAVRGFFGAEEEDSFNENGHGGDISPSSAAGDSPGGRSFGKDAVQAPPRCFGLVKARPLKHKHGSPLSGARARAAAAARLDGSRRLVDIAELPDEVTQRSDRIHELLDAVNMEAAALQHVRGPAVSPPTNPSRATLKPDLPATPRPLPL